MNDTTEPYSCTLLVLVVPVAGKFMIKTQTKEESKFLRRILPHYFKYTMASPHSYITRFFGLHRVKMHHLRKKLHFVVMQSVFYGDKEIHRIFDIKVCVVVARWCCGVLQSSAMCVWL